MLKIKDIKNVTLTTLLQTTFTKDAGVGGKSNSKQSSSIYKDYTIFAIV